MPNTVPTRVNAAAERSVSLVLDAETMFDADTGRLTLIASADHHHSVCEVSPARLRRMVADARKRLDEIEQLADQYEAVDTLRAIVAEHEALLEEWEPPAEFAGKFLAFSAVVEDGQRVIVVPAGQDPVQRLRAVASVIRKREWNA